MDSEIQREVLDDDPALREIVQLLADAYHPLQIYLFGSKARGTAGPSGHHQPRGLHSAADRECTGGERRGAPRLAPFGRFSAGRRP